MDLGNHAATLTRGKPGILHGAISYLLQDEYCQVAPVHSVSAGLDYPGVGPEHSHYKDTGRVRYDICPDCSALEGFFALSRLEGIVPALESAHALGYVIAHKELFREKTVIINLSGRGDKDMEIVQRGGEHHG